MATKKYYAVRRGIRPGIYDNWAEAEAQVRGYAGARFKGFSAEAEARAWLAGEESSASPKKASPPRQSSPVSTRADDFDLVIYTDGGAIGNPGPGGYGAILINGQAKEELCGGYRLTTNNRMELMACIAALREVQEYTKKIVIYSDSSYVVNGISKGWARNWKRNGWRKADKKPVLNQDLWAELLSLIGDLDVHFHWVRGHSGNPFNERCDELAVQMARGSALIVDEEYEAGRKQLKQQSLL